MCTCDLFSFLKSHINFLWISYECHNNKEKSFLPLLFPPLLFVLFLGSHRKTPWESRYRCVPIYLSGQVRETEHQPATLSSQWLTIWDWFLSEVTHLARICRWGWHAFPQISLWDLLQCYLAGTQHKADDLFKLWWFKACFTKCQFTKVSAEGVEPQEILKHWQRCCHLSAARPRGGCFDGRAGNGYQETKHRFCSTSDWK